jgi:hypothetical protein
MSRSVVAAMLNCANAVSCSAVTRWAYVVNSFCPTTSTSRIVQGAGERLFLDPERKRAIPAAGKIGLVPP